DLITGDEIIVLDGYHFDTAYQKRVRDTGASLVYIDDHAEGPFDADAVINHSPGVDIQQYLGKSWETRFFLGPKYALIDPPPRVKRESSGQSLLVTMGGSDPSNFTCQV